MKTIYLKPKSNFVGSLPHSDTLFGSICWGVKLLYGEEALTRILDSFANGSPPFLISSAFPFIDLKRRVYFLPKPECPPLQNVVRSLKETKKAKEFKKLLNVTASLFTEIISGKLSEENLCNAFIDEKEYRRKRGNTDARYVKIGSNLIEKELLQEVIKFIPQREKDIDDKIKLSFVSLTPFRKMDVPRNAVDRLTGGTIEGRLFYDESFFFNEQAGLYFLVHLNQPDLDKKITAVMSFFADHGIGGDVSSGKGQFDIEIKEETMLFTEPESGNSFVTLSLYYPGKDEWDNFKEDMVWYEQLKRKGKVESAYAPSTDIWKESVLMFKEGSTFPLISERKYYGQNPIVKQQPFSVQQYGYAFPVRMVTRNG